MRHLLVLTTAALTLALAPPAGAGEYAVQACFSNTQYGPIGNGSWRRLDVTPLRHGLHVLPRRRHRHPDERWLRARRPTGQRPPRLHRSGGDLGQEHQGEDQDQRRARLVRRVRRPTPPLDLVRGQLLQLGPVLGFTVA